MIVCPKDFYSEDYFYPKKKIYTDEFGVQREYYGPSKEWSGFGLIANFIKEMFPDVKKIKDIGCSAGSFVDYANRVNIETTGVDISNFAINNCVPGAKGKVRIADITIDKPSSNNDMATAMDLLEHIYQKDLDKAIQYIKSSIKQNGHFFACIATARHPNELWQHTNENDPVPSNRNWLAVSGHVNIKWFEDWIDILYKHGFNPNIEMMYRFQLWRTRNDLKDTDSWSIRNVYIGKI